MTHCCAEKADRLRRSSRPSPLRRPRCAADVAPRHRGGEARNELQAQAGGERRHVRRRDDHEAGGGAARDAPRHGWARLAAAHEAEHRAPAQEGAGCTARAGAGGWHCRAGREDGALPNISGACAAGAGVAARVVRVHLVGASVQAVHAGARQSQGGAHAHRGGARLPGQAQHEDCRAHGDRRRESRMGVPLAGTLLQETGKWTAVPRCPRPL